MDDKLVRLDSLTPCPCLSLPLLNLIPQRRHKPHPLALLPIRTPPPNMHPQHVQNLTILPPLRHRPIRGLKRSNRLRPLARRPLALDLEVLGGCGAAGGVRVGELLLLCRPVVDVPVVLVEEEVVLVEEWTGECGQVRGGEGGEEEVGFEGAAFAGLVWMGEYLCGFDM